MYVFYVFFIVLIFPFYDRLKFIDKYNINVQTNELN